MSRWIDAGLVVVCGGLLFASGCSKKEPPQADSVPGASAKVTASASASAVAEATESGGFVKGEALQHMPPACRQARIYLDAAGFATLAGAAIEGLEDQWAAAMGSEDGETAKKVLKVLEDGGFDPAVSVKELAVCMDQSGDDMVFAVGMDLSKLKGDPLDLILKAAEAAGEKGKAQKKQEGKLEYLLAKGETDGGAIAVLGSSLVVGKDLKALQLAQKGGGAKGFKDAAKQMLYVDITVEQGHIVGSIADAGKDLKLIGSMKLAGKAADELKKDADATLEQMKAMVDEMAGEIAKAPPLKGLAEPIKALKLSADGDTLKAELTVPKRTIQGALKATSEMKPEELMQLMR